LKVFLSWGTVNPECCYLLDLIVFFLGFLEIDSELTFENKSTLIAGMITVNSSLDHSASKRLDGVVVHSSLRHAAVSCSELPNSYGAGAIAVRRLVCSVSHASSPYRIAVFAFLSDSFLAVAFSSL
jgi:hypothetical protein